MLGVLALLTLAGLASLATPARTDSKLPASALIYKEGFIQISQVKPVSTYVPDQPDMSPRKAVRTELAPATPKPKPSVKPKARSKPKPQVAKAWQRPSTRHRVSGKASWYCKAGVSVCHHRYPPGSMVAAACGKLRSAMGPNWRGRVVNVRASSGRQVTVKLVDWCGSRDKLIDLYWEPMRRLGGSGVLPVRVSW